VILHLAESILQIEVLLEKMQYDIVNISWSAGLYCSNQVVHI